MKVVFIGADPQMAEIAAQSIRLRWPTVTPMVAATTTEGFGLIEMASPDVVLIQSSLGDMALSQALQQLRNFSNVPLVVLGQDLDEDEVVAALETGADDYIRMPCEPAEIMARIWALLRRVSAKSHVGEGTNPRSGRLLVNPSTYEVLSVGSHAASETTPPEESVERPALAARYGQSRRQKLHGGVRNPFWAPSGYGVAYHRDWAVHPPRQNT